MAEMSSLILALETSCDETAVAVTRGDEVLASEISSQTALHAPHGGVVPEIASRNHLPMIRPLVGQALHAAGVALTDIDAVAATAGPGLASSLLVGNTAGKALALGLRRPFLGINHLEGHLLSPFMGAGGPRPAVALVVSGGHTLLLHCREVDDYELLGRTRDDAAGECFDKVGKLLGLPYPGGPQIDRLAAEGDPAAFDFPRSMLHSGDLMFSFSGLKTAVLYTVEKLPAGSARSLADLCASVQAAIVEVLLAKTLSAMALTGARCVAVSGGVSCNRGLRRAFSEAAARHGFELLLAAPELTTDNAAMIGHAAGLRLARGLTSSLSEDIDPNLPLSGLRA